MFNTLAYAKMLEEVGFSREQSETSIQILVEIMEDKLATKQDIRDLASATQRDTQELSREIQGLRVATQRDIQELRVATQHDIQELRVSTQHDIQELRVGTQHDLRELESRLTLKVGTMLIASVTLLTAIVTAIHKFV